MNRALTEVGFYGKLPCRGDFLQRRVPQEFVDPWDSWLQQSLHECRSRLGEAWLERYLTGPVWRFALPGGICGAQACLGLLVPSVDRVGRYFPLTVIAQLDPHECLLPVACASHGWFAAAESLALDALEAEALDFDTFDDQVALLREHLPLKVLAQRETGGQLEPLASWWTEGTEALSASWLCTRGLPDAVDAAAMLTGSW